MNPVKKGIVGAISWYCTHVPFEPGKTRLQRLGLGILDARTLTAYSRSGHTFILSFPEDFGFDHIYWRRTYETGTLTVLCKLVRDGDVVFDIGANIGWYTVHMASLVPRGSVHAFEPMPPTFDRLRENCRLNGDLLNTHLNMVALGEAQGSVELHSFEQLGHGHASLSTLGRSDFKTWRVPMTTLDAYMRENSVQRVDIVKMDVEGAEMSVLRGAQSLFHLDSPPIWIIEMNAETSNAFGYRPPDLIEEILRHGDYQLFRVIRSWGHVTAVSSPADFEHGDNAVCVPSSRMKQWQDAFADA